MTNEIADRLELPVMVCEQRGPTRHQVHTVSVDAADRISIPESAPDRAHTLRVLADGRSTPAGVHLAAPATSCRFGPGDVSCADKDKPTPRRQSTFSSSPASRRSVSQRSSRRDGEMMRTHPTR
jgi:3,4-dihydroxy 2-butanone 4-phosphate synthase/GTP cyclohydrolase II